MDGRGAKMFFSDMNEGLMIERPLVRECEQFFKSNGCEQASWT
jgi:hypothetical protein